jgi:dTDP-4-dehydrorhamnose 3,5-epimerase
VRAIKARLSGVVVLEPIVHGDERGFFRETWNKRSYERLGVPANFVQDNLSYSQKGVLRGLHFQNPNAQGKLVSVLQGEVFDVAVDLRVGSPTFGEWVGAPCLPRTSDSSTSRMASLMASW